MIWRALGVGMLALLLAASAGAMAAAPSGPRLTAVRLIAKPPRFELLTVNQNGGAPLRLAEGDPRSRPLLDFSSVSWFPDGERIALNGIVRFEKGDDHEPIEQIFTVRADGSDLRAIPGTKEARAPVPAPDGQTLAFTRIIDRETPTTVGGKRWKEGFHGSAIWILDLRTGSQRQLTPWRDGLDYSASSFAPDGSSLLATLDEELLSEPQPVALEPDGGGLKRLLDDGFSPVYSPDGSKVALVRRSEEYGDERGESTDLYVVNADGSGLRRLTRTPRQPELSPNWDPSGERLAYVRLSLVRSEDARLGFRRSPMQINADGSCPTTVRSPRPNLLFLPVWQPGPGRGAGRIEC